MAILPNSSIPGWPSPSAGVMETLTTELVASGFGRPFSSPEGLHVGNASAAQNHLDTYVGSAKELQWNKDQKQAQLDTVLETNFNLIAFIRNGTLTPVTGAQVSNFLATECNNYRTLRAQIAAATTVAQVNAIDVNSGWPNNP